MSKRNKKKQSMTDAEALIRALIASQSVSLVIILNLVTPHLAR